MTTVWLGIWIAILSHIRPSVVSPFDGKNIYFFYSISREDWILDWWEL